MDGFTDGGSVKASEKIAAIYDALNDAEGGSEQEQIANYFQQNAAQ